MSADGSTKVVLITGAGGGLGRALAQEFSAQGWQVVAGVRTAGRAETGVERGHPGRPAGETPALRSPSAITIPLDVTKAEQVEEAIATTLQRHGRIDALINNAGVTADALVASTSDEDWARVLDVNLRGAFLCARAVARPMIRQRDGHIINLSSLAARTSSRGRSNYAAAKAGVIGLTHSLAKELGSRNVRVNAILPGVMPTNMTADLSAEQLAAFAQANALGRINSPDEVARFIVFLTTTQNISGQVFALDSRIAPWA